MNKNLVKAIVITASAILINACHHENPLKTHLKKASATFLVTASANSEKRLHFAIQKDSYGFAYLECMEGKKSPEIRCEDLYRGMITFAKEGDYSEFRNLKLADLTDPELFKTLADEYAETALTIWPNFVSVGKS